MTRPEVTPPDAGPVQAVLHVGAPKCGSSALQRALSLQPELTGACGRRFAYIAARASGGHFRPVTGAGLSAMARRSVHGYANWPNQAPGADPDRYWGDLAQGLRAQHRRGVVPVLSSEGWISHAGAAAGLIRAAGLERVAAQAFVRPPLDWLNAAYWQWAIWTIGLYHPRQTQRWLERARFDPGPQLAAWARVPGVSLHVDSARGDVVAGFAARYGLPLTAGAKVNVAPPPALTGFFLRHRRFRPTAHDSAVEFVVQRWCRFPPGDKLWAFLPRFVNEVWPRLQEDAARLLDALPPDVAQRLSAEPGWTSVAPYGPRMKAGPTDLDSPEGLAALCAGLDDGLARVAGALRRAAPPPGPVPGAAAALEDWDRAIAARLDALIKADRRWRRGGGIRGLIGA